MNIISDEDNFGALLSGYKSPVTGFKKIRAYMSNGKLGDVKELSKIVFERGTRAYEDLLESIKTNTENTMLAYKKYAGSIKAKAEDMVSRLNVEDRYLDYLCVAAEENALKYKRFFEIK